MFAAESLALGAEVRGKDVLPLLSGDLRPEMVEALKRIKAQVQDRLHHQQPARQRDRQRQRPLALCRRGDGAVRPCHRIRQDRPAQARPAHLPDDGRGAAASIPKKCVYLDDLGVNLKPAREMGMTTIKVVERGAGHRRARSGDGAGAALRERAEGKVWPARDRRHKPRCQGGVMMEPRQPRPSCARGRVPVSAPGIALDPPTRFARSTSGEGMSGGRVASRIWRARPHPRAIRSAAIPRRAALAASVVLPARTRPGRAEVARPHFPRARNRLPASAGKPSAALT